MNTVSFAAATPQQVDEVLASVEHVLAILNGVSRIVPGKTGDMLVKILDFATLVENAVKPYAHEPWFLSVVTLVVDVLQKKPTNEDLHKLLDDIKKMLSSGNVSE